ncbi:HlyD family type I secretion periplasmic adaptor subunit [Inhella gelatinilytica]|uniref:Membrane fusion protein (MFP) family protein n=1 Tax=Inhella gelatinilytica TaxID=2795030 RepID=A0A931NE66_9BURK|nr:HlyD family type I secretion periplasmic adaptor subunit [Inhella gelatinilytica]MBH9552186.1 HlyD family type I secretion periplasmic adaptor subunit [Inhella gelatinilytica]
MSAPLPPDSLPNAAPPAASPWWRRVAALWWADDRAPAVVSPAVRNFEEEAQEWLQARTHRNARRLVRTAAGVTAILLIWAAFARVDEVTRGEGKVVSSRSLQAVQSLDGGVVTAILTREGDVVDKGQVLLKIDETRATSGARENAAMGLSLQARVARLKALAEGSEFLPPVATEPDDQRVVDEEKRLFEMRRAELVGQVSIMSQQLQQRQQELGEMRARKVAAERGLELAQAELSRTRPLLASGAVSEVDIIKLERDVARSRGEAEQSAAQILRVAAAVGEAQRKVAETELTFRNEARKELAETLGRLNALNESAVALNDKVDKSQIRSPVRGRIQRLLANTVGGVVQPGKDLVEIVPLDDALVLEAKVLPRDIAFIHPEQPAIVKFTAYDFSIYGGLEAVVENISPDTVVDEKGNAFYVVRVRTLKSKLGDKLPIIPGMTAEVDVLTGSKTILAYLLKPVLKIKDNALRER